MQDTGLREAFAQELQGVPTKKDLYEALSRISEKGSWDDDDQKFLEPTTADQYETFFASLEADDLHDCIAAALRFGRFQGGSESDKKIAAAVSEASAASHQRTTSINSASRGTG